MFGLIATSTVVWLVEVGLFQHETPCTAGSTGCPTVYGYDAPLQDGHPVGGALLLGGFLIPAAWFGWRRLAPPLTVGASLALGPTLLAWWTAPRGDNDGLWTLVFWQLPALGGLAAVVSSLADRVGATRRGRRSAVEAELTVARPADRIAALVIDVSVVGAVMLVPLTALSHTKLELVAGVVGVVGATLYLAVPLAWRGHTLGQFLVGVSVLDAHSQVPPSLVRSIARSLIVVLEVMALPTLILALPAVAELLTLSGSGRTLTDRLMGTSVVSQQSRPGEPSVIDRRRVAP